MNIFGENWSFQTHSISYKSQTSYGPRIQSALQLVYLYDGQVDIYIDQDEPYSLRPSEITLLLPGHREFFRFHAGTHHGWCYAISKNYPEALLQQLADRPKVIPVTPEILELDRMARAQKAADDEVAEGLQNHLIAALFYQFFQEAKCLHETNTKVLHPSIHKAQTFIRNHLEEDIDLESIAKASGVSAPHLIRLFKASFSQTPIRYLWEQRLNTGAYLMKETGLTAAQVSERCGFSTPQHFSRAFTKHFAKTPRQIRMQAWNVESK